MKKKSWFSKFYLVLIMAFFYLPIVYVVLFSFNASRSLTNFTGFSLQWYQKMFATREMMESIYYSTIIAVIATVVSTIVGTIVAIGLSKSSRLVKVSLAVSGNESGLQKAAVVDGSYWTSLTFQYNAVPQWQDPEGPRWA